MTTTDALDLQNRLSRLPFFAANGVGVNVVNGLGDQPASWPRLWSGGAQFGGVMEDLQTIVQKAPTYLTQLVTIVNKAAPYLPTIVQAVEDPALPQVIDRVQKLKAADAARSAPSGVPAAAAPTKPGVGLSRTLPLWDAAIGYTKYPWAPWAIAGGAIIVLGGIGFGIGRWTKRCKTSAVGRRYRRR